MDKEIDSKLLTKESVAKMAVFTEQAALKLYRAIINENIRELPEFWQEAVREVMQSLEPKYVYVIYNRLVLNKTLQEVANQSGVSRERVRQIESKGIRLIKHYSRANILRYSKEIRKEIAAQKAEEQGEKDKVRKEDVQKLHIDYMRDDLYIICSEVGANTREFNIVYRTCKMIGTRGFASLNDEELAVIRNCGAKSLDTVRKVRDILRNYYEQQN